MKPILIAALALAAASAADVPLRAGAAPFPPLSRLPYTDSSTQDAMLAGAGFRRAAADAAWIDLLQYAGQGGEMPQLEAMCRRVVRLDPRFHRAYLYGASLLGWFVNRPEQAVELLKDGMRDDPGQKLYPLYLAALTFQKKGDVDGMVATLESTLDDPDAPTMMRPILANIYKQRGEYKKSLALWEYILNDDAEAQDHPRAVKQIAELRKLLSKGP